MKTKFFPLLSSVFFIALLASCSKTKVAATTTLFVTVKDGVTLSPSSGATVSLYESEAAAKAGAAATLSATTNQAGIASFTVGDIVTYWVVATNGAKKNYYNGLVPTANVNGVVSFQDTNGDGLTSIADTTTAPFLRVTPAITNNIGTTIY